MSVFVCMLRAVNVGGRNMIKMEVLREICGTLKFRGAQTYVQSGNVVFACAERDATVVAKKLQAAIEKNVGFRPEVMVRTAAELREVVARNPFAKRRGIESKKLLVTFFSGDPDGEGLKAARGMKPDPEEMWIERREAFVYYPNGFGQSKLAWAKVERMLKVSGTARNWNSVVKLLEMAEAMEAE
jgi:uncharacterized protein (DUF1697 family)